MQGDVSRRIVHRSQCIKNFRLLIFNYVYLKVSDIKHNLVNLVLVRNISHFTGLLQQQRRDCFRIHKALGQILWWTG